MLQISLLDKVDFPEKSLVLKMADSALFFARGGLGYEDITIKKVSTNESEKIQIERTQKIKGAFARVLCLLVAFTILAIPTLIALAVKFCAKGSQDQYISKVERLMAKHFIKPPLPKTPIQIPPSRPVIQDSRPIEIPLTSPLNKIDGSSQAIALKKEFPSQMIPPKNEEKETKLPSFEPKKPNLPPQDIASDTVSTTLQKSPPPSDLKTALISSTDSELMVTNDSRALSQQGESKTVAKTKKVKFDEASSRLQEKKRGTLKSVHPIDLQIMELEQLRDAINKKDIEVLLGTLEALSAFIPEFRELDAAMFREEFARNKKAFCKECSREFRIEERIADFYALREFAKELLHTKLSDVDILQCILRLSDEAQMHIAERILVQKKEFGKGTPKILEVYYANKELKTVRIEEIKAVAKELLSKGVVIESVPADYCPDSEVEVIDSNEYLRGITA